MFQILSPALGLSLSHLSVFAILQRVNVETQNLLFYPREQVKS